MNKLKLLLFSLFLGFIIVDNVSATTYQFSCGFSSREMWEKYEPHGFPGLTGVPEFSYDLEFEDYANVDFGYRSEIEFTFQRTGLYDVKIVDCHKAEGYWINGDRTGVDTDWGKCPYNSYVFDWNDREGMDMTKPTYCPDGIDIDGNVVKSADETKSQYVYVSGENYKTPPEKIIETSNICPDYKNSIDCKNSPDYACIWVDKEKYDFLEEGYCNVDNLLYVGCGGASDIPMQVPKIISMAVNLLKIATPIILIIISMITLVKALAAGKEDEIKKATSSLIKKMIAAALVFFVVAIVQFVISKVADDEDDYKNFTNCLNCFLNNDCDAAMYYKTVVAGEDMCTPISTEQTGSCDNMPQKGEIKLTSYLWDSALTDKEILYGELFFNTLYNVKEITITYTNESLEEETVSLTLDRAKNKASTYLKNYSTIKDPKYTIYFYDGKEQIIESSWIKVR